MRNTTFNIQHALHNIQHTTCITQHSRYNMHHTTFIMQHSSYHIHHTLLYDTKSNTDLLDFGTGTGIALSGSVFSSQGWCVCILLWPLWASPKSSPDDETDVKLD